MKNKTKVIITICAISLIVFYKQEKIEIKTKERIVKEKEHETILKYNKERKIHLEIFKSLESVEERRIYRRDVLEELDGWKNVSKGLHSSWR